MTTAQPSIVDLPDGSFVLRPDPKRVFQLRLIVGASSVTLFGAGLAFVLFGVKSGQIPLPVFLVVFLLFGARNGSFGMRSSLRL